MQLPRPPRAPQTIPSKTALATLFVSSLIIFAPHFTRLPIWMSLFCACFVLWRITLLRLNRKVPSSMIRVVLTIVMISLVILQFQTIFGRTAGSALLLVFAGLKILESKDLRDAMFCNCLFMVVVLSAFLFDQSPVTATYGLVSLIIIVSNFNRPYSTPRPTPDTCHLYAFSTYRRQSMGYRKRTDYGFKWSKRSDVSR